MDDEKKFAVLIDAENISERYIKFIMDEISNEGIATYKRIYGDWTTPNLNSWKHALLNNSILPFQQFAYTTGKNATDSAMIIDAMDIFYTGRVNGFCIVSSDSDFTRLASRLREGGMIVIGMGESKTPNSFISACNRFKYLDILSREERAAAAAKAENGSVKPPNGNGRRKVKEPPKVEPTRTAANQELQDSILAIISENSDDDGWLQIGELGDRLVKRHPDFDVRNFNFSKLSLFVKTLDYLETKKIQNSVFCKIRSC